MHFNGSLSSLTTFRLALLSVGCLPLIAEGGELTFNKSVGSSASIYQTSRDSGETDGYAVTVKPKLVSIYSSNRAYGAFTVDHSQIQQGGDLGSSYQNYTNYSLNSVTNLIENVLRLSFNAQQRYRAANQSDNLVSDQLLFQDNLGKTTNYTASLDFTSPNPTYVGWNWQALYGKTTADKTTSATNRLDSTNKSVSLNLFDGKELNRVDFSLSGQFANTTRANSQDFKTTLLNGNVRFGLIGDISFMVLGSDSEYQINDEVVSNNQRYINSSSYGAGLRWSPSDVRYIEVTYNNLEQDNLITKYVGLNANWAFTQRTNLGLSYGKRFYGDTYSADFSYNLKSFRTALSYSESVTSFSRLSYSIESVGLFVCPVGSAEFAECFQVEDLSYVLQPGEEFRSLNDLSTDVTDEVILNKVGQLSFGYDKRKLKVSVNLRSSEIEYLESQRVQNIDSIGLNLAYQLSKRIGLALVTTLSTRETNLNDTRGNDDTLSMTASMNRKLSKNATLNTSFRYVDRDSDNNARDVTDKRITVGLNYTF